MGACFGSLTDNHPSSNSNSNGSAGGGHYEKAVAASATTSGTMTDFSLDRATSDDVSSSLSISGSGGGVGGATTAAPADSIRGFTYADLKLATRNFRPDSVLGEGGFGRVFKGYVDEKTFKPVRPGQGMLIAVKKLNVEGLQGHKEWLTELRYLGELHHPNLVKLIGFCAEADNRLLVYEFMKRGSLDNHLFRRGSSHQALPWQTRMKIAVHAARGLSYLHTCERPIIYRDFKSSNILLDSDYNAKLSDFGLAKDGPTGDNTHVTTRIMGTYGYAAPEYIATGRLTPKSDVYGYGVVLLEILTGRRAVDKDRPHAEENLVDWATPFLTDKNRMLRIMDQRLDGQYSLRGARRAGELALRCLNEDAKLRPSMKHVLRAMEPLLDTRLESSTPSPYRSPVTLAQR